MANKPQSDSFLDMFSKLGKDLKMPAVDVDAILSHHRKNLEALEQSAKAGAAGATALMNKQREALQATLSEITDMARTFSASASPQDLMTKQADFARKSFETALKNAGEVAELVKKSSTDSIEILRQRIRDSMEEIRSGYDQKK